MILSLALLAFILWTRSEAREEYRNLRLKILNLEEQIRNKT